MLQRLIETTATQTNVITTDYTTSYDMDKVATLSVQSVIDVNTPAAGDFSSTDVDTDDDTIDIDTPGTYVTGLKGQFSTTGTLPTGISAATDYFVISDGSTTLYQFATTLANALAGTQVDITGAGAGDSTFTPTSIAGATISYQRTNIPNAAGDGPSSTAADWSDIDTATAITVDATNWYTKIGPEWRWFRIKATLTAGMMTITNYVLGRGESKS